MGKHAKIHVRDYRPADLDAVIEIFQRAVREVAVRDYSPAHIAAWSRVDRDEWADWRLSRPCWLAEVNGRAAGFSDLEPDGHLDMMFVHPDFQGIGVATALMRRVERHAASLALATIFVEASLTARPFFSRRGFQSTGEHLIIDDGLTFVTYRMTKKIAEPFQANPGG
jgi:putative acetyltransferase